MNEFMNDQKNWIIKCYLVGFCDQCLGAGGM